LVDEIERKKTIIYKSPAKIPVLIFRYMFVHPFGNEKSVSFFKNLEKMLIKNIKKQALLQIATIRAQLGIS